MVHIDAHRLNPAIKSTKLHTLICSDQSFIDWLKIML